MTTIRKYKEWIKKTFNTETMEIEQYLETYNIIEMINRYNKKFWKLLCRIKWDTFTRGKLAFLFYCVTFCYCEMHLPHINVSPVNTALENCRKLCNVNKRKISIIQNFYQLFCCLATHLINVILFFKEC